MTRRLRLFQIVLGPAVALALSLQRLDWPGAFWSGKQTLAVGLVWLVALVTTSEGVARLRLHYVPPSGIRWTKGKGVIGKCWALGKDVGRNLAAEFGGLAGIQKDDWEAMPADFREGLTFEEFERTWDLIGCVVAVPIAAPSGAYLGCVSVDAPGDSYGARGPTPVRRRMTGSARRASRGRSPGQG